MTEEEKRKRNVEANKRYVNSDKGKASRQRFYDNHGKSRNEQYRECQEQWRINNPDKVRSYVRRTTCKKYGLTPKQYDELLLKQNGVCAICRQLPLGDKVFDIDHDHSCCSGKRSCGKCVRGLIHNKCNLGLGAFNDDPEIILKAYEYIVKYKEENK